MSTRTDTDEKARARVSRMRGEKKGDASGTGAREQPRTFVELIFARADTRFVACFIS